MKLYHGTDLNVVGKYDSDPINFSKNAEKAEENSAEY